MRSSGDRHLIHVHIDEKVLRDAPAIARSEINGQAVPPATIRRLCCDGSLVAVVEDARGKPLSIGTNTRTTPTALRRALEVRDQGCRFPGCCNTRFVGAHHVEHWAHGGETSLDNLILLCRWHHRFLHEYGYSIVRADGGIRFARADGESVRVRAVA